MSFADLQKAAAKTWSAYENPVRGQIRIGTGTCGRAAGADDTVEVMRKWLAKNKLEADIVEVGCLGLCYVEPLIELSKSDAPRILYGNATSESIEEILEDYFINDSPSPVLALAVTEGQAEGIPSFTYLPVMKNQVRVVLRNCGVIDPCSLEHYVARGGYEGLQRAISMASLDVIEEIKKSGLRGRGGAGFPTGMKWEFCNKAKGDTKYVICNADEGDPGAFMDRSVVESDPHAVLEGLCIAAFAIGASHGYIYVRAEYPLAIVRLEKAIADATDAGLLGENILGSGFSLNVLIKKGAGAFVCGEETALLASIEGQRGMPRPRPPFPAQSGLHGKPTNINNVETLANVPFILREGYEAFAKYGSESSKGTKTFALAGKVTRTGLIEVPLGLPLRDIVFGVGGGVADGKRFKAVQTGGPSGGCIPESLLDTPVDYQRLAEIGAIMGSGGMIVMDEDTCMVDVARYFIGFTQEESCGKCVPCRLGTRQMLQILTDIASGKAEEGTLELLAEIAEGVKAGSLCGLGQTAPNPILTTLKYYREEYVSHITHQCCPAARCQALVRYEIYPGDCIGCGACKKACPSDAISGKKKEVHTIDRDICTVCGRCLDSCKFGAVNKNGGQQS